MKSLKGNLFVTEIFCVSLRKSRKGILFRGSLLNCFFYWPKKSSEKAHKVEKKGKILHYSQEI